MEEIDKILGALASGTDARHVTRGWPGAEAEELLPLIAVQLAGESCTARYDDVAYLMETEWYLRVFAADPAQADSIGRQAGMLMHELGYEPVFAHEEATARVHQCIRRYRKTWETERMDEA
ncbi:MAG: hypothetical protein E7319_05325 [Clostridiales bacterium]|nr:hypothetical protein [Clostridiales bacterium]